MWDNNNLRSDSLGRNKQKSLYRHNVLSRLVYCLSVCMRFLLNNSYLLNGLSFSVEILDKCSTY